MDLREYLRIAARYWWLILLGGALGLAAGFGIVTASTREYTAGAQIFVATASAVDSAQLAAGNMFTEARVQSYVSIATSPRVTEPVIRRLELPVTPAQLASQISASARLNTVLIDIAVRDRSPDQAARLANAVATQFSSVVADLEDTSRSGRSPVKLTVTRPATVPTAASSPRTTLDLTLGLLVGVVLGFGVAVLRKTLDNSVASPDDLEQTAEAPVLAVVGFDKRSSREPIALRADSHGPRAEGFRQLRTNLQFINIDQRPRVIAVTSPLPAEGKTSTALNLAATLAEAGFSVCLVEADLRKPSLARTLGLIGDVGLTTVLVGKATVEEVTQNAGPNLAVITSGPIPPNPSELLVSAQTESVLRQIAQKADYTIIDSAPLLPVTDGAEAAALADANLLVVRSGRTTRHQVRRAIEVLAKVNKRPVGTILNMAKSGGPDSFLYTHYYAYRQSHDTAPMPAGNGSRGRSGTRRLAGWVRESGWRRPTGPAARDRRR
jgi:capsular exopolysaccharide synthesis family protein